MEPTFYTAKCTVAKMETYKGKVLVTLVEDEVNIQYVFAMNDKDAENIRIGAKYGGRFSPLKDD